MHYHFISAPAFDRAIRDGRFVEFEEVYPGLLYGTMVDEVDHATPTSPVLLDIDVKGALRVKEIFGDEAFAIFIAPPSFEELKMRLTGRGTESSDAVETRLRRARVEMTYEGKFDSVVVNDEVERATDEATSLVAQFLGRAHGD